MGWSAEADGVSLAVQRVRAGCVRPGQVIYRDDVACLVDGVVEQRALRTVRIRTSSGGTLTALAHEQITVVDEAGSVSTPT
jgi:hypothetical protein